MATPEQQRMTPTMGVRGWLLLLALVTGLPTTIFSVFAMLEHVRAQQEKTDAELRRQVLAVALAVDADLSAKAAMLHALAASQEPESADIGQLYRQARGVGSAQGSVQSLSLVDREGGQLFSTWVPLGVRLPSTGDVESVRRVLDEDRPVVSGLFQGSITNRPVTALGVPVQAARGVRYALRMFVGVGDNVLRRTARVLEGAVRPSDAVGRLGGDEFVLCLALRADTACEVARSVAARIVSGVARIGFGIGCSVGISLGRAEENPEASGDVAEDQPSEGTGGGPDALREAGPDETDGPDEEALDGAPAPLRALLEEADKAMYLAKQAGKNSYHLHDMSTCD